MSDAPAPTTANLAESVISSSKATPTYHNGGVRVLIPQQFPGAFYYPPCKCDLVNQIRYFNPKTREFFYHTAQPWPIASEGSGHETMTPPTGVDEGHAPENLVLAGEPESFNAYPHHYFPQHMMGPEGIHGPYLQPGHQYPQSPYSVPVVPIHDSGICELILVILVLLLWLYSFYRLYLVWQKTLNFSEASIQGPQGWDLLVNWVIERIQIKKLKSLTIRKKSCAESCTNSAAVANNANNPGSPNMSASIARAAGGEKNTVLLQNATEIDRFGANLDHIERCVSPDLEKACKRSSSGSSFLISSKASFHASKIGHGSLFSQPCSLQILHEDETSTKAPPPPLAAFGSHKMTATQLRRARMMNKQMSEDITSRPSKHGHISLKHQVMTSEDRCRSSCDTRSLTKLSESCEMRDLSGRTIYDHRQKFFKQCSLQQYSDSEEV